MNDRMKDFRRLQAQYANTGKKMSLERYLAELSRRDPNMARQVVLSWFEDHPCMVEVTIYCGQWYLVDGGQPA